jgi:CRISPR-associated protein Cmr2
MGFVRYDQTGSKPLGTDAVSITPDARFGIHPGAAQGISISAGIVVAHHKTPLRETISQAHRVLDGVAKDKTGRNAVAIRLRKRSGGDRDFSCQWDDTNIFASSPETLFESFCSVLADAEEDMSTSLIYRLEDLRVALEPLMDSIDKPDTRDRIVRLFLYEVGHTMSGSGSKLPPAEHEERARQLAGICIRKDARGTWFFEPEAAVIARFLPQNPDMEGHQ